MSSKKSKYLKFIEQGLKVAQAIPKYFSEFSNKIFDNHQKTVLLVLRQKLKITYRDLIELLKITNIPQILNLKRIPHFTTLIRFSKKLSPILVSKLLAYSTRISKPKKLKLGIDATGLELDNASVHYAKIKFLDVKKKKVLQLTACATMDTQLITSIRLEKRKSVVNKDFLSVLKESAQLGKINFVAADKGYDAHKHHQTIIQELKAKSLIKLKNINTKRRSWKKSWRKIAKKQFDEKLYHQRSKIETIFSVIKRKYGSYVKAKTDITQLQEGMQKTITYNIDRLCKIISLKNTGFHQSFISPSR